MPRKSYYMRHREEMLEANRAYYHSHKEAERKRGKAYHDAHKVEDKRYRREYYLAHREEDWEKREQRKLEVFTHYSGSPPKCATCGETDITILTIDHINNDGAKHRRIQGTGTRFYNWLKKNNYPTGFQVLCHNCNARKEYEHRRARMLQVQIA